MMVLIDKEILLNCIKNSETLTALISGGYTNSKIIKKAEEEYLQNEELFSQELNFKTIEDAAEDEYCNGIISGVIQEADVLEKTLSELIKEL